MGRVLSVNAARERPLEQQGRVIRTGIFKEPAAGAVRVGPLGLEGDHIHDRRYHGGPDKAVYGYAKEDYAWWEKELGKPLPPGVFGENLTLEGLELEATRAGDILAAGTARLQAVSPRIPCRTLAARMGDPGFAKRFQQAGRFGVYFRVLTPGEVKAGDAARWESRNGEGALIVELGRRDGPAA
jgi:MOSC domain-containing protein YiiM